MSRKQARRIASKAYRRYRRWSRNFPYKERVYWATYERTCERVGEWACPF